GRPAHRKGPPANARKPPVPTPSGAPPTQATEADRRLTSPNIGATTATKTVVATRESLSNAKPGFCSSLLFAPGSGCSMPAKLLQPQVRNSRSLFRTVRLVCHNRHFDISSPTVNGRGTRIPSPEGYASYIFTSIKSHLIIATYDVTIVGPVCVIAGQ